MESIKLAILMAGMLAILQVANAFEISTHSDFNNAKIGSIYISACPEAKGEHCGMKLGTSVTYKIEFETSK